MLRYSNKTIQGTLATLPSNYTRTAQNVTSPGRFKENLRTLLEDLRGRAAGGSSTRKVAAGNATGPDFQMIFGLVQCTPDLSKEDCTSCLIEPFKKYRNAVMGKEGAEFSSPAAIFVSTPLRFSMKLDLRNQSLFLLLILLSSHLHLRQVIITAYLLL